MILGIDIGGSTTDIVGFKERKLAGNLTVEASDPLTSATGALGSFLEKQDLDLSDIDKIAVTGVGSSYVKRDLFGIQTIKIPEFEAIGSGGAYLTSVKRAVIVSMGTGTAIVFNDYGEINHMGGTGVGGGTIVGLGKAVLNNSEYKEIVELARTGSLDQVDLFIKDISLEQIGDLKPDVTASNFGNANNKTTKEDYALGIINLVFQTVGMLAVFAAQTRDCQDIVITGKLAGMKSGQKVLTKLKENKLFPVNFYYPKQAEYSTAIGAAISSQKQL
ncbi:MAG: type II pantothenate kinase [Bacillota bacterium]